MVIQAIVLDAGPIGIITNPNLSPQSVACNRWLQSHVKLGNRIIIPEIADYEVRRELLRANKKKGVARYLAIATTNVRHLSRFITADLWQNIVAN